MIKYLVIMSFGFILVSCNSAKKVYISKNNGFNESNLSLSSYMLSVRGEGKDLEMSRPLLLWTNPKYTNVKEITITKRAKDSIDIDGSGKTCHAFRMTNDELKRYFYLASKISHSDVMKKLEWTDCYIEGNMIFESGEKAYWTLDAFMHGSIIFEDKKKEEYDVYCPQCSYTF